MECQGECKRHDECAGEIKEVIVYGTFCPTGLKFNYCQTAREEDERRGFTVEAIDEHRLTPSRKAPKSEANAQLIAIAPEMRDLLANLVSAYDARNITLFNQLMNQAREIAANHQPKGANTKSTQ